MKNTVLFVDDEKDNVEALERVFRKKYNVLKATSGAEALKLIKDKKVAVIISDQRMPEMTGVEFLAKTLATHPNTVRILLTGYTDIQSVIDSINSGQIYRYVTKPWDPVELESAVQRAVERHELQEELRQKNIDLEKAYKELKHLDEAKMHFMYLVNHELKTPLTAILSFGELLGESSLTEDQSLYVNRIQKSSQRLKKIIDDVLVIVSSETGQIKKQNEVFVGKEAFQPLLPETEVETEKRGIDFHFDGMSERIQSDKSLVRNVVQRLLHNAAKFADSQSRVHCKIDRSAGVVHFSISNSGKPIPKEKIKSLLEPFTLNEEFMNHTQGTGLGLSVCHAILRSLGSHLEIESQGQQIRMGFSIPDALVYWDN